MTTDKLLLAAACLVAAIPARAQDHPARRLTNIVGVAVEEYGKGIDANGRMISEIEYREAVDFLADARVVAERLAGAEGPTVRALLDTMAQAVAARRPPAALTAVYSRFVSALGADGALELPSRAVDLAAGQALYARNCASCHGDQGRGDGPAAVGMTPPPPALGDASTMADASPALLYRVLAVGVAGTPMAGWAARLSTDERWDIIGYLQAQRASASQRLEGEGRYMQRCASCHGAMGAGNADASAGLTRLPPEIGSFGWQVERSDVQLAAAIRAGIPGSAMPPGRDLTDGEVTAVVAHLRALGMRPAGHGGSAARRGPPDGERARREVLALLDQAMAASEAGRTADAGDRAFDAYIAFEPLETRARAKDPGLVAAVERTFADFKGAVKAGDSRAARQARDAIEARLPRVLELTRTASGRLAAFSQSFLIILREGFEAILVLGAIAAFLLKTGNRARLRSLWIGAGLALVASAVTAVVLQTVLRAVPASREIIEGATMLVAVVVLFSVSYWLISKVEAARWQQFIREKVSTALEQGGGAALAFVAFLAVYREGAETALFYQALFAEGGAPFGPIALGIVAGGAALAVIFTLFYRYGVRIPLRPFFAITSVVLYYMAFVFMGKGVRELQEGDAVPITTIPGFPSVEAMGIYNTVETLLAQLVMVALFVFAVLKTFWPVRSVALPSAPPMAADAGARVAHIEDRVADLIGRVETLERRLADQREGADVS